MQQKLKVLIVHGPNLNLLGTREPEVYGSKTLADINVALQSVAETHDCELHVFQSNAEHELIDRVQQAAGNTDFIIINPAAFTHTSIALRDALMAVAIPFIEVHLSNVHAREAFRRHSYFSDKAVGVICGLGSHGYEVALKFAIEHLNNKK